MLYEVITEALARVLHQLVDRARGELVLDLEDPLEHGLCPGDVSYNFV